MLETAFTLAFLSLPATSAPEPRNPDRRYHEIIAAKRVSNLSVNAFVDAEKAFGEYLKKNLYFPAQITDIFPQYGFRPAAPEGMTWAYGKGTAREGWYFCLHGAAPDLFAKSFGRTKKIFQGHEAYFAATCGAAATPTDFGVRAGSPVAITYWVAIERAQTVEVPVEITCKNLKEDICKKVPVAKVRLKKIKAEEK